MPFQKGTAADYVDLLNKLIVFCTSNGVATASVSAGGTGYAVGNILTASGGTFSQAATFRVLTLGGGGAVATLVIVENGAYTSNPSSPVATTGGAGTGCTITVTFASNGWTLKRESKEAVSATVSAGGSSHAVGDILTVSGGVGVTSAAQFKVATLSGSAVATVTLWRRGNMEESPSNAAATTSSGSGTGCTLTVTYRGVVLDTNQEAVSATVAAGGTGYSVNDILTGTGGTFSAAFKFKVTAVSSGAVTAASLDTKGNYTVLPTNPVSTTVAPAGGTGCTLNVTWQSVQPFPNKVLILDGSGSGSDHVYVGVRTFDDAGGNGARNWELVGFTGFSASTPFTSQAGISPGRWDGAGSLQEGAYMPLTNSTITYWLISNGRRLILVANIGSTYTNAFMGWVNPFATAAQYPYPMLIMGCSSLWNRLYSSSVIEFSGMVDPISVGISSIGPGLIRDPGGTWRVVANSGGAGSNRAKRQDLVVYPCGTPSLAGLPLADVCVSTPAWDVTDFVPGDGSPGTINLRIAQNQDSPNDRTALMPTMIVGVTTVQQMYGEIPDVYWISALGTAANLVAQDGLLLGSETYRVFQNCNRTDLHAHFAVREA